MGKDILFGKENKIRLNEVKNPLNMDDYTGDNAPLKCFNIDKNEYAVAKDSEEFFASIDDDTVIISVKENERLLAKGDINALEVFSFLYQNDHLTDGKLYIISNNSFDIDTFKDLMNTIGINDVYYEELDDKDFECCINVTQDEIKISSGKGIINKIELNDLNEIKVR